MITITKSKKLGTLAPGEKGYIQQWAIKLDNGTLWIASDWYVQSDARGAATVLVERRPEGHYQVLMGLPVEIRDQPVGITTRYSDGTRN